jgi:hypothetical protein
MEIFLQIWGGFGYTGEAGFKEGKKINSRKCPNVCRSIV